jgi:glycosyltransferase involved in cell wall biosynthesis
LAAEPPSIAVVVPNRNDSRYLPRCLRSRLEQDDPPDEVIVVDDQSTDDSVAVIRSLIAGHSRAQLLQNPERLGTNGALNRGFDASRSEYVLFLSSNDFVLPGLFARARAGLARHRGAGLWSALGWLVDEDDRVIRLHRSPVISLRDTYISPEDCVRTTYRVGNWSVGSTLIFHRAALDGAGRFDPAYMGLADLVATLIVAARKGVVYSPVPFGASRVHPGSNLSRTLTGENLERILARLGEGGFPADTGLHTGRFQRRLARRLRFAAARSSSSSRLRVVLSFLLLCPFDVFPALWNRLLGSAFVLLRHGSRRP